jgi:hypothetical protein
MTNDFGHDLDRRSADEHGRDLYVGRGLEVMPCQR